MWNLVGVSNDGLMMLNPSGSNFYYNGSFSSSGRKFPFFKIDVFFSFFTRLPGSGRFIICNFTHISPLNEMILDIRALNTATITYLLSVRVLIGCRCYPIKSFLTVFTSFRHFSFFEIEINMLCSVCRDIDEFLSVDSGE